jgi:hypothetical protein
MPERAAMSRIAGEEAGHVVRNPQSKKERGEEFEREDNMREAGVAGEREGQERNRRTHK